MRILIVDDMPQVRQELRTLLDLTGTMEIVGEAGNGLEAIELASRLHPEVVVMDLEMPVMNGYAATRHIKERGLVSRVVILSVHGDADSLQRSRDAGADDVVVKGTPLEALLSAIFGAHHS